MSSPDSYDDLPRSRRDTVTERANEIVRDETRLALLGDPAVVRCAKCGGELRTEDGYSGLVDGRRVFFCRSCNLEDDDPRDEWPVHQPECFDAPIPGRQWFGGCEPGGDWDSEYGRYTGTGPRVDPVTGICEGCHRAACPDCGRENCPDHPKKEETC